ncbi:MAG: serine hydrolase domain-containing protein [Neoaquamicrobium sediminum]|uniref:serine hydrolase domain-containing protein n=1 Tax=Neoaquamicrobium sediminum TaxID=1849104 RepID=UPI004035C315
MTGMTNPKMPDPEQRFGDSIDVAIERALAEQRIVGCVVLVADNGELVYERAAGYADREAGLPMKPDTAFRFASVTKPFTTMAALKLMEGGRLSHEDSVTNHLPAFRPRLANGAVADMRISHLMAHLAGLDYGFNQQADGTYAGAGISDGLDDGRGSLAENLERIASVPLDQAPGEGWRYSVATDVLGAVIEAVVGEPLDKAIGELVCRPLGLNAAFVWPGDDLAISYYDANPQPARMTGPVEVPLPFVEGPGVRFDPGRIHLHTAWPSGGAGMAGRASDVLTLLEAYRTGNFLHDDLRQAARLPRTGAEAQMAGPGWGASWLGAVLVDPGTAGSAWSPGSVSWGGVYGNWWGIDFTRKRTVVSLTNTAYEGMIGEFARDIAAAAAM